MYLQSNIGFSLASERIPIGISDFLKAGLSFSESPKYITFALSSCFNCERTLSNAKPLLHSTPYTSRNGWLEYFCINGRSFDNGYDAKFALILL